MVALQGCFSCLSLWLIHLIPAHAWTGLCFPGQLSDWRQKTGTTPGVRLRLYPEAPKTAGWVRFMPRVSHLLWISRLATASRSSHGEGRSTGGQRSLASACVMPSSIPNQGMASVFLPPWGQSKSQGQFNSSGWRSTFLLWQWGWGRERECVSEQPSDLPQVPAAL